MTLDKHAFISSYNSLPNENVEKNPEEVDALEKFINENFFPVQSISPIRNGNHYVLEINKEYIIRIKRLASNNGKTFLAKEEMDISNSILEKEIEFSNNIYTLPSNPLFLKFLLKLFPKKFLSYKNKIRLIMKIGAHHSYLFCQTYSRKCK